MGMASAMNKSATNLPGRHEDLTSPQLRSRVSLFNLNSAGDTLGSNIGSGLSAGPSTNYLNIYKSPRSVSLSGNLVNGGGAASNAGGGGFNISDSPKRVSRDSWYPKMILIIE